MGDKVRTNCEYCFVDNLYDVFMNIRDDEAEHCKTMKACQTHGNLRSPHSYPPEDSLATSRIVEMNGSGDVTPGKLRLVADSVQRTMQLCLKEMRDSAGTIATSAGGI